MKRINVVLILFLVLSLMLCSCSCMPDNLEERPAPVESIDILLLESFPVQVHVVIEGYLPNPCHEITRIEQLKEGNTFYVTVMMKDSGLICIQIIGEFQEVVALDVYGLPAGTYQVDVNGVTGSFILEMDNIVN